MHQPILTAAEMRAAEARTIAAGTPAAVLMERAGTGVAEAALRLAGPMPALVLCGPGNNGGDGYVAARVLKARGMDVRVAALGEAMEGAAAAARTAWDGPVEPFTRAEAAPLVIDALFGTGLTRPLDAQVAASLKALVGQARCSVAVDLPSGVETDSGACMGDIPSFDMTVTFATLKPAHRLQPSADRCGRIVTVDIGVQADSALCDLERITLPSPGPSDHKYTRGLVAVIGGAMPGASALAALSAAHAGAGYVVLFADDPPVALPHAIVRRPCADAVAGLADPRVGSIIVGPGLGRDAVARKRLAMALESGAALVIDGDALHLLDPLRMKIVRTRPTILTPHEGEFRAMFPDLSHFSKVERARAAAARTATVIVYKGADTVVAAPDGRAVIAANASPWLSAAGTGDVLAGAIGAMLARGLDPFAAAQAGVWLHAEAARRSGTAFVADDLAHNLSGAW